jgi:Fic family protein
MLVEVQNLIVDEQFREPGYRSTQNFIGQTIRGTERVFYVPPRPGDLEVMMGALETLVAQIDPRTRAERDTMLPPIVAAALVAFSFVYIHPFTDGNGRLHRFLIHYVLARLGFTPENMIFPISAAILADLAGYHRVLADVDRRLMPLLTHDFTPDGSIVVRDNDADLYAYLDLTPHAEALYRWTEQTIDVELVQEIDFLRKYDRARRNMRLVLDMPDKDADLFITLVQAPPHRLSQTKRKSHFPYLTDEQLADLQTAVASAFAPPADPAT